MSNLAPKLCLAIILSLVFSSVSRAQTFQYFVTPIGNDSIHSVTGLNDQQALGVSGPKYGAMINAKYADLLLGPQEQKRLNGHFSRLIAAAFPSAVVGPNQVVHDTKGGKYAYEPDAGRECRDASFKVGHRNVFAATIGVSRLSAYVNDYAGSLSQIIIPVTYTLRFVKLNGASIVFSKSETVNTQLIDQTSSFYAPGSKLLSETNTSKVKESLLRSGEAVIAKLVESARSNFQPKQSQVRLSARDGPYFVFDRGSEVGFIQGDTVYPEHNGRDLAFVIEYATDRLAVAVAANVNEEVTEATKSLRPGELIDFNFAKPGRDSTKPSILVASYEVTEGQDLPQDQVLVNALQQVLTDDLGFVTPFNLVKRDPDYERLLNQIKADVGCSDKQMWEKIPGFSRTSLNEQNTPGYFLKVDFTQSPAYQASGVGGVTSTDIFRTSVTLSVLDISGVLKQTANATAQYELKRTDGKGISVDEAAEVNLKNVGLDAIRQLVSGFAPRERIVKLTSVDSDNINLGETLTPTMVASSRLYRRLRVGEGRFVGLPVAASGFKGTAIELPAERSNRLTYKGLPPKPDTDYLVITAGGEMPFVRQCDSNRQNQFFQHKLLNKSSEAQRLIPQIIGPSLKNYVYVETNRPFKQSVEHALKSFDKKNFGLATMPEFCLLGLELQNLTKLDCNAGKCTGTGSVASGVRIFSTTSKVAESVIGATFDFKEIDERQLSSFVGLKAYEHHVKNFGIHGSKLQ